MYQLDKQFQLNRFSRFHLLCGKEVFLINLYVRELKKRLANEGDDMNCLVLSGEEADIESIAEFGMLAPFMAERRVVVVRDSGWFTRSYNKNELDKFKQEGDRLMELLGNLPQTTYVIFAERNTNPKNARLLYFAGKAKVQFHKPSTSDMLITEFQKKEGRELIEWIAGYTAHHGKRISKKAAHLLPTRIGNDMYLLSAELDKLIGYIGDREGITDADIDAICSGVVTTQVYEMVDAVSHGNVERTMSLYRDLLYNKESIDKIMSNLGLQFNTIFKLKSYEGSGIPIDTLAAQVGMPANLRWKANDFMRIARRIEYDKLQDLVEYWTDLSEQTMTIGLNKQVATELFLIQALTKR
ncbi:MAG: DNA polymerase III subunit delta [Eubacterium sp.]|nr:DNA polymerase III subunit delta [Eubacterium sp.]